MDGLKKLQITRRFVYELWLSRFRVFIILDGWTDYTLSYEGVSINNQPIPFPMNRDGHDFHALFQYMFYIWVQNCTRIESFFKKILNVKQG